MERRSGSDDRRGHALIAGTGRAGTSFLVRFLDECGLDVRADELEWFSRARAGLERFLLEHDAPYVVKDPWLFAYCDQVDLEAFRIDALIVPVRDLAEAAASRITQERIVIAETLLRDHASSDVYGVTPGGAMYSLDVNDQARVLAVGFHKLLHWAIKNELPLFLLDFPRMTEDADYLIEALIPWLADHCDRNQALEAFHRTAKITEHPAESDRSEETRGFAVDAHRATSVDLERRALLALLDETRTELQTARWADEAALARLTIAEEKLGHREIEIAMARAQHQELLASRSWRLTKPLRALGDLAKRVRGAS